MVVLEIAVILAVIGWQLYLFLGNKKKADRLALLFPKEYTNSTTAKVSETTSLVKSGAPYHLQDSSIIYQVLGQEDNLYQVEQRLEGNISYFLLSEEELTAIPRQQGFTLLNAGGHLAGMQYSEDFLEIKNDTEAIVAVYQGNALSVEKLAEPARRIKTQIEESLQATSSTPLYIGLLGTFLGVAIGLSAVLVSGIEESAIDQLLLGVTIAMTGSFCGLLFSLLSGQWLRSASATATRGLHGWEQHLQLVYGHSLDSDFASSLQSLKGVLQSFNQDFLSRVADFKDVFSNLYQYTSQQERFINALKEADVHKISEANLAFFEKIEKNEALFERFGTYMQSLNESLENGREATKDIREVVTELKQLGDVQLYIKQNEELIRKQLGYLNAHQEKMDQLTQGIQQHFVEAGDEIGKLVQQRLQVLKKEEQDAGDMLRQHFDQLKQENVYQKLSDQLQPIQQMQADTQGLRTLFADTLNHLLETQKYIIRKINQDGSVQSELLNKMDTLNGQLEKLNEPKGFWHRLTGK